ncbi:Acetyl-CoA synthetase (ADP-forming) alpha and beta chains, putative [Olavius algarvensis associated proteobacterium Delta 3]|nr:Acetyl-CoA synthetase (ADP-forming) alpha and beta chains, putative [Olavius algarvensis associated proteobacterium Delta 3]CAB5123076.1 Acetyl-CoA synthetase (ADP-forming) alpha and beta chains, putative [Olavius algarvensis associated proteobacterium Delta 3]
MLEALFNPKRVAVIGASTKELHIGNRVIRNLIDFGFKGEIYPINPKADEIWGIPALKSILDAPDGIDVVHMVIPAKFVPQAVEDCGTKGVKHIIINSGGFSEIGPEGEAIEMDFLERAEKYGIRIFGPNCQGIINSDPEIRAYCNFTFTKPEPGAISIVALSGGVAEVIHQGFAAMGVGTRIYASNGNACDVTIPEIIRYLGDDPGTQVLVTYVEGLRDPSAFLEACTEVAAKKPVLAMKAGRTREGAKAAASHTGGLAKEDIATDLIFKKAGVLSFSDEGELIQSAVAFASQPRARGNRVGIITNTGGPAVIATDILAGAGLELPPLSSQTEAFLKERLYPEASVANPVDVLATGTAEHYRTCLDAMMEDDAFDCVFVNFVTPFFVDTDSIAREIAEVNQQKRKPLVCNLMTDKGQWVDTVRILQDAGVPCYALPGEAARAMANLVRYHQITTRDKGDVAPVRDVDSQTARRIVDDAVANGSKILAADEVYRVLEAYGISVPDWRITDSVDGAIEAAEDIGYPVVLKADAPSVIHKSDMGGVSLNLMAADALRMAAEDMQTRISDADLGFFVQKYMPGGLETIMGAKAEDGLGHAVMFGLGGIYVEVLKDVVFELTPVTAAEATEMLTSIKGTTLLQGVRGQPGVDQEALIELIQRLSQLLEDLPVIQELDLNPVMAFEEGALVVDARILL